MLNRRGIALVFAVASLVACGSTDDDPTTPLTPTPPPTTATPAPTTPTTPPAPRCAAQPAAESDACLRISAGVAVTDDVHVIAIHEAPQGDGARVWVSCTDKPITLVLASTTPTRWIIEREAGASVKKVIVGSTTPAGTIEGLDAATVVEEAAFGAVVSSHELSSTPLYPQFIAKVRDKIGGLERTFQGKYTGSAFAVPPSAASAPKGSLSYYALPAAAAASCGPAMCAKKNTAPVGWNFGNPIQPSTQPGTTATANGNQTWGFFQLSKGARCGKHYFEVTVTKGGAPSPMLAVSGMKGPGPVLGSATIQSYMVTKSETIGVALDLDVGQVFYRGVSGWVTNPSPAGPLDPAIGTSGTLLSHWTYDEVRPSIDLPKGDSAEVRLAEPFTYPLPAGYAAGLE